MTQKVYSTLVKVDQSFGNFRPGMTADAEILISERDHVLKVPIKAVLQYYGKDHVAVKKPDGGFEWREVVARRGQRVARRGQARAQARREDRPRADRADERGGEAPEVRQPAQAHSTGRPKE